MPEWPSEAAAVLERAIERHGGRARWQRGGTLHLRPMTMTGGLPWLKGVGRTFNLPGRVDLPLGTFRATFRDYPEPGASGEFDAGRVVLRSASGEVLAESANHRPSFDGLRKWRRWQPIDALYFFGYALSYYHAMPFELGRTRFVRMAKWGGGHAITVDFPPEIHTHCTRQTFFFDATGLIVRHDYTAEVAGTWARACHRWLDYTEVAGLQVAQTRDVRASFFGWPSPFVALHATIADFAWTP